ncbi:MAG: 50S ribosomal protein L4 [Verrucomicrobiales bacterium]
MSETLSVESAQAAGLSLVEGDKGSQAVHDVIVAMRANRRSGTANTKTRGEVAYSGKKPWRQKGTGRARAGSAGSPIWVGGGVVFGPRPRDYSKTVTKKVRQLAFRRALTERVLKGDVIVVDAFAVDEPKTKIFVQLLQEKVGDPRALIIGTKFDHNTMLAGRNVKKVQLTTAESVNTEELLLFKKIVITKEALPTLAARTGKKA